MEENKDILTKTKSLLERINAGFEKVRIIAGVIIIGFLFLNAFLGYYSISKTINNPNEKATAYSNPLSFLFRGSAPKEDPNFKVDYDEKQAGHMYGAKFTKEKGIFGFIENYIQVYKMKKGVERDYINVNKELNKQYENQ